VKVSPEIWEGFLNLKLKCQKIKRLDDLTSFEFTPVIKLQFQIENKDCTPNKDDGHNPLHKGCKKRNNHPALGALFIGQHIRRNHHLTVTRAGGMENSV